MRPADLHDRCQHHVRYPISLTESGIHSAQAASAWTIGGRSQPTGKFSRRCGLAHLPSARRASPIGQSNYE